MRPRICAPSVAGSIPSTRSVPPLTGLMQEIIGMVDVLPAPLGPRKPNDSPLVMVKSTPSTATKSPKRLTSPHASTMGDAVAPSGAPVPVRSESETLVIGEECDVIVRERYLAAREPNASGRPRRGWEGTGTGGPAGLGVVSGGRPPHPRSACSDGGQLSVGHDGISDGAPQRLGQVMAHTRDGEQSGP